MSGVERGPARIGASGEVAGDHMRVQQRVTGT